MANCLVTGIVATVTGHRVPNAVVAVRRANAGNDVQFVGDVAIGRGELTTLTDANGAWQLSLEQGLDIVIRIDELGLHKRAKVPMALDATLEELLNANL